MTEIFRYSAQQLEVSVLPPNFESQKNLIIENVLYVRVIVHYRDRTHVSLVSPH